MSARRNASIYPLALWLDAPLHHGSFDSGDTGNLVPFRRMPLAQNPVLSVPVVSGNALRGALRRIIMRDLLALCDLTVQGPLPPIAWDKLYAAVANGGTLNGAAETRVDPDAQRALREAVPALSVLGAALYSWQLAGRIAVGWLWPVCEETVAHGPVFDTAFFASAFAAPPLARADDLLTEVSLVRHVDRDQQDPAKSGVTPMPVTVEALIPGTILVGQITQLRATTLEEIGAIGWGLEQLMALGGKSAAGFGRITVHSTIPPEAIEAYRGWRDTPERIDAARRALMQLVGYDAESPELVGPSVS